MELNSTVQSHLEKSLEDFSHQNLTQSIIMYFMAFALIYQLAVIAVCMFMPLSSAEEDEPDVEEQREEPSVTIPNEKRYRVRTQEKKKRR